MTDFDDQDQYGDPGRFAQRGDPAGRGRRIRFDPRRAADADVHGRAVRHTRRVRWLRVLLPALAVVGVLGFFTVMRPGAEIGDALVTMQGVDVETRSVTMDKPRISGFEGTRRSYEVEAVQAIQDLSNPNVMRLETLRARLGLGNGVTAIVHAKTGIYDSEGESLVLRDGVTVKTSNGYDGTFEEAVIDIENGTMTTARPLTLGGKEGTIRANAMEVHDRGKRILFTGAVEVTYIPPEDKAPVAGPAAAAPGEATPPAGTTGGAS